MSYEQISATLATTGAGAEEEARAVIASVLSQIITLIRNVINYLMEMARRFVAWSGEHPLAAIMFAVNVGIWVS